MKSKAQIKLEIKTQIQIISQFQKSKIRIKIQIKIQIKFYLDIQTYEVHININIKLYFNMEIKSSNQHIMKINVNTCI